MRKKIEEAGEQEEMIRLGDYEEVDLIWVLAYCVWAFKREQQGLPCCWDWDSMVSMQWAQV